MVREEKDGKSFKLKDKIIYFEHCYMFFCV